MRTRDWFEAEAHAWRRSALRAWLILLVVVLAVACVGGGAVALLTQGVGR